MPPPANKKEIVPMVKIRTKDDRIRQEMSYYGKLIEKNGLTCGPGGNMSVRSGNLVYLSPSGFSFSEIKSGDWFTVDLRTGKQVSKKKKRLRPTCEISMHLGCYLVRPDIKVVIHTHPILATALATAGVEFKALFPDFVAILGSKVPTIEYVIPAGEEIREAVTAELKKGWNVLLLKNHGAIAVGSTLKEAYYRSLLLEESARYLVATLSIGKEVRYLTPDEVKGIENLEAEDYRRSLFKRKEG